MQEIQLKDIALKLKKFHCEFQTIEVKSASEVVRRGLSPLVESISGVSSTSVVSL